MKIKKFFAVFLFLILFISPCYATNPDDDIIILYTNDVHCGVDDFIGYSGLAYYRDEMKKLSPYVTLVDAGDHVQGATIGIISHGRYIIEIMNELNYEIVTLGNHEFDYGWGQFENFNKNLKCGYISCNLRDLRNNNLVLPAYKILNYGNTKVAYVGICTPETIGKTTPTYFKDENKNFIYDFDGDDKGEKLCASVQKAADDARKAGADFVIAVGHLGENEDVTKVWSAPFIAEHTRGINAFIDGHSHEVTEALKVKNLDGEEITITQTGTKLHNIGLMKIHTSGQITTKLINEVTGRNENITNLINTLKARYEDTLKSILSRTNFDFLAMDDKGDWLVRNGETNLCNFAADAFLNEAGGLADIAFVNGGGIRTNITKGGINFNNALSVCPFGNTLLIIEVPGQSILDDLEIGARLYPANNGGLLHPAGLTYEIDAKIESPVSVNSAAKSLILDENAPRRVKNVMVHGEELDPKKLYKVIGTNFVLVNNGDGHIFANSKIIKSDFAVDSDSLAHYMKNFDSIPEVYRYAQGRIKFTK